MMPLLRVNRSVKIIQIQDIIYGMLYRGSLVSQVMVGCSLSRALMPTAETEFEGLACSYWVSSGWLPSETPGSLKPRCEQALYVAELPH